jgi:hypothetical protein
VNPKAHGPGELPEPSSQRLGYISVFLGVVGLFCWFSLGVVLLTQAPFTDGRQLATLDAVAFAGEALCLAIGMLGISFGAISLLRREGVGAARIGITLSTLTLVISFCVAFSGLGWAR